jgi:uncharacterized membrane protein
MKNKKKHPGDYQMDAFDKFVIIIGILFISVNGANILAKKFPQYVLPTIDILLKIVMISICIEILIGVLLSVINKKPPKILGVSSIIFGLFRRGGNDNVPK